MPPMAKLRHIAMSVPDISKTARFYEEVFGMTRVAEVGDYAINLSDGVMSLAIFDSNKRGKGFEGLQHIGFVADDLVELEGRIEGAGGTSAESAAALEARRKVRGDMVDGKLSAEAALFDQRKFHDPCGTEVEVVNDEFVRRFWRVEL